MRGALKIGETILQSCRMAVPDDLIYDLNTGLAFGVLTLTSQRLVFEPNLLSLAITKGEVALGDIARMDVSWTKVFKVIPLYPTLNVILENGSVLRFAAISFDSLGPKRWIDKINAAKAGLGTEPVDDQNAPARSEQAETAGSTWFYERDGARIGPLTQAEFDYNWRVGHITPDVRVSENGRAWQVASSIKAGTPQTQAEIVPPPLPAEDRFAWGIALLPLAVILIELAIGINFGWRYLILNVALCFYDSRRLATADQPVPNYWWSLVVPAYLWKRASLLKQPQILVGVWVAAFVASMFIGSWGNRSSLEAAACPLVTKIIQDQLNGGASCKKVTITSDTGNGFYLARSILDNGNELRITIEDRGKEIYVRVPNQ